MGSRRGDRGIEVNTLAMLDASGERDSKHFNDDGVAFIQAVRASSIVPELGSPPTKKMYEAIFRILRDGKSLELIMSSYHLLNELDKRFPRVRLSNADDLTSSSDTKSGIVMAEEAWSPFAFGLDVYSERQAADRDSSGQIDSSGFNLLIEKLAEVADNSKLHVFERKFLASMLLFQYFVNVLEGDFLPRHSAYNETMNWAVLRESLLNTLLGSRRINYKVLIKDCISILCYVAHRFCQNLTNSEDPSAEALKNCHTSLKIALLEAGTLTSSAMKRLLVMIIELDKSKKAADMAGLTTRSDGVRTPLMEIIVDHFTYDRDVISPFLQVFTDPKWKLEIVLQYLGKYVTKPSVRTRRSNFTLDDATLDGILVCFSNVNSTKGITRKMGSGIVQLLLAHAFQAYLSLSFKSHCASGSNGYKQDVKDGFSSETCKNMISAFNCLKKTDGHMEMLPLGKEALFMAASLLSTKS